MKIEIIDIEGKKITFLKSNRIVIKETQDALDLMADAAYHNSNRILINKKNIIPEFFDLKSGIAGEILQKFSTYNVHLAIVGDFTEYTSKSLRDFIFESNKYGRIIFVSSVKEAKEKLVK